MAKNWTLSIPGKDIRAYQDDNHSYYYSIDDVCEALGLVLKKETEPQAQDWSYIFTSDNGEEVLGIRSQNLLSSILISPKLEARAHLHRKTRGVKSKTIGGAYTSPRVVYDARDVAICLGYANDDPAVAQYFLRGKRVSAYVVYKLAVGSPLPDAEEFVDELFDEARLTYLWQHMKFGPHKNNIIPFEYKGCLIRTFAEEEEGGFLFTLIDVYQVLGIEKGPRLGKGMRKIRVIDYYYAEDERGAVVTEAGLKFLLEWAGSPEAEEFGAWVERKVLPSLKQPHPWGRPERVVVK